jgi:tetratricopeptide (TPR) repeat protein
MSHKRRPRWKRIGLFVVDILLLPWAAVRFHLGLTDDGLDAVRFRENAPRHRIAMFFAAIGRAVWRPFANIAGVCGDVFWQGVYFFNLVADDADATQAIRRGLARRAAPPVLALLALSGVIAWSAVRGEDLVERYEKSVQQAIAAKDSNAAMMSYRRLASLRPNEHRYMYEWAVLAAAQGDEVQAVEAMESIAPMAQGGYAPAHFWLAERLVANPSLTRIQVRDALTHLTRVIEDHPDHISAHARAAQLLLNLGCIADAEPHLVKAADAHPELALPLAKSYLVKGRTDDAAAAARKASAYFAKELEEHPEEITQRLLLADSLLIAGEFEQARDVLRERMESEQRDLLLPRLHQVYLAWADADLRSTGSGEHYLDRLNLALIDDPSNVAAIERLIAAQSQSSALAPRAARILDSLHFDAIPATVHVLLGNNAIARNAPIVARRHLEEALHLDPDHTEAANNLAWLLSHVEPLDCRRALELSNATLGRFPSHPTLLATRGHVLACLGRWKEAQIDLKTVCYAGIENAEVLKTLEVCREHLLASATDVPSDDDAAEPVDLP